MATNVSGVAGLAGRYAAALFDLAAEDKAIDEVAADLGALSDMLVESDDLRRLVRSPVLTRAEQSRAVAALLERAGAIDLTRRFIGLLAERRRLFALADIVAAFNRLLAAHRGEVRAEVTAAVALDDSQVSAITAALKRAIGGDVAVETKVDDALLGGLVVRVGSRMVDTSMRTKLQRLHLAMKGIG